MRIPALAALPAALLLASACDYTGEGLFAVPTEGVPGVSDLGTLTPAVVASLADVQAATIYAEVGAIDSASPGGVTFSFVGTGSSVCVWVDPELAFWNQSVGKIQQNETWLYPDNATDDGDLDLFAGFSVYYGGSPGQEIGTFRILYEDQLGNRIPVELNECVISANGQSSGGHSGRGSPESCTLRGTQPGVSYTVLMQTWSLPQDDDRLGFGLLFTEGSCGSLRNAAGLVDECIITGEAADPSVSEPDPVTGILPAKAPWEGSELFEAAFCGAVVAEESTLVDFCLDEAATKNCEVDRCFCGDPADTPTGSTVFAD